MVNYCPRCGSETQLRKELTGATDFYYFAWCPKHGDIGFSSVGVKPTKLQMIRANAEYDRAKTDAESKGIRW